MNIAGAMRRALIDLDVPAIRKIWAAISPHLPQPKTEMDALIALHVARTAAESVPLNQRAYSHAWLRERGLPSRLPDHLKQPAERLYPITVGAVGVSVVTKHEVVKTGVGSAMNNAILDCYANGDEDPRIVKPRMMEAKDKELRALFGLRRR